MKYDISLIIEASAKVIGIDGWWVDNVYYYGNNANVWNPLESNTDAFQLQCDLGLSVDIQLDIETTAVLGGWLNGRHLPLAMVAECHNGDAAKATRLAISKAALELWDKRHG